MKWNSTDFQSIWSQCAKVHEHHQVVRLYCSWYSCCCCWCRCCLSTVVFNASTWQSSSEQLCPRSLQPDAHFFMSCTRTRVQVVAWTAGACWPLGNSNSNSYVPFVSPLANVDRTRAILSDICFTWKSTRPCS